MKACVFPGSFDPITVGHVDLVRRALPLFDQIIIAIGINSQKQTLFSLEQRTDWIKNIFSDEPKISVDTFEKLTANYCKKKNAHWILRGLRSSADFDYEKTISQLNFIVGNGVETFFLISQPQYSHISSTIVREIIKGGGDASPFLPASIGNQWSRFSDQ